MYLLSWILLLLFLINLFKFVKSYKWQMGRCLRPRSAWQWDEHNLLGIKHAFVQTKTKWSQCISLNITKGIDSAHFNIEMVYRFFYDTHLQRTIRRVGWLKTSDEDYFKAKLHFPFSVINFFVISESPNCLCVYTCQQFLVMHRWDITTYHSDVNWCGWWWWERCKLKMNHVKIDIEQYTNETFRGQCPYTNNQTDEEGKRYKTQLNLENSLLVAQEKLENKIHTFYQRIQNILGDTFGSATTKLPEEPSTTPELILKEATTTSELESAEELITITTMAKTTKESFMTAEPDLETTSTTTITTTTTTTTTTSTSTTSTVEPFLKAGDREDWFNWFNSDDSDE